MAVRPRLRVTAEVLDAALRGEPTATISIPSRVPLQAGRVLDVDLWVQDGGTGIARLEVLAFATVVDGPGTATLKVLSAWREGETPPSVATSGERAAMVGVSGVRTAISEVDAPAPAAKAAPALTPDPTPASTPAPAPPAPAAPAPAAPAPEPVAAPPGGTASTPAPEVTAAPAPTQEAAARTARTAGTYSVATRPNLPEEIRRPGELCAEYTRSLVKLLNRTQYYGAQIKARDSETLDATYELLVQLIGERHEFGYVLERTGDGQEVLVDGVGEERRKLSAILRPEAYETFVPKLIDYMEKYQIVSLAYRHGIAKQEWETVLEMMSGMQSPDAAKHLTDEVAARGVFNVSILTTNDLTGKDFGVPWQIRVALARMTRDLGALPMMKKLGPERVRKHRMQLILDVVRPFGAPMQLKTMLVYCPTVQENADKIAELAGAKLEEIIGEVMRPSQVAGAARVLFDELKAKRLPEPPFGEDRYREVLMSAATRLAGQSLEEGFTLLRDMYAEKMLRYEDLPPDLQEWIDAEDLSRVENPIGEAPRGGDEPRWLRVQSKAARLLMRGEGHAKAMPLLVRLMEQAGVESPPFKEAMEESLPRLVDRYCSGGRSERAGFGVLIKAVATQAAPVVIEGLLAAGEQASSSAPFQLMATLGVKAGPAIKDALSRSGVKPGPLRALLALAGKLGGGQMVDAVKPFLHNADGRVRAQAVAAYAQLAGAAAKIALAEALRDRDEQVSSQALTLFAARKEAPPEADTLALGILEKADPPIMLQAALRYAGVSKSEKVKDALVACVEREIGGGLKRLFGRGGAKRPEVLIAACPALAAIGEDDLLKQLAEFADATVRGAAEQAVKSRG